MLSYEDLDEDGFTDLIIHVRTEALQLTMSDVEAVFEGRLNCGTPIHGFDSVRIVP